MLRRYTGRWQAGIVTIVAARPAMGKSSLLLATADACSAAGFGAHLFSLGRARGRIGLAGRGRRIEHAPPSPFARFGRS
jgi:replicative DNA helicase